MSKERSRERRERCGERRERSRSRDRKMERKRERSKEIRRGRSRERREKRRERSTRSKESSREREKRRKKDGESELNKDWYERSDRRDKDRDTRDKRKSSQSREGGGIEGDGRSNKKGRERGEKSSMEDIDRREKKEQGEGKDKSKRKRERSEEREEKGCGGDGDTQKKMKNEDLVCHISKVSGLPFGIIFNFLSLRDFETLSYVSKFFQQQKNIYAPAFYNKWLSVDSCSPLMFVQIGGILKKWKGLNNNNLSEVQIKKKICFTFGNLLQRCGVRSIYAPSTVRVEGNSPVSFYHAKSKRLFFVFWEASGHVYAYNNSKLDRVVQKWQIPFSYKPISKTTINDDIYVGVTSRSQEGIWNVHFFRLNLDGSHTQIHEWKSVELKFSNTFVSGDKVISNDTHHRCGDMIYTVVVREVSVGGGTKSLWKSNDNKHILCDNGEVAVVRGAVNIEIVHLASGVVICILPYASLDLAKCADIATDKNGDLNFVLCYIVQSRIHINLFAVEINASEYTCKQIGHAEHPHYFGDDLRSVTLQKTKVILTQTNGTILFFNRENMEHVLVYELFNSVGLANIYISEDLHILVGTIDGMVLMNQYADEVDEQLEPPIFASTSLPSKNNNQLINFSIQKTHYLYRKAHQCTSRDQLECVFAEFSELKDWSRKQAQSRFIRWRNSKFVQEGFWLLDDLMQVSAELDFMICSDQIYLSDTVILDKLSVFPATFPLCKIREEILTKHDDLRRSISLKQILEACRDPTNKISISDMRRKLAYVRSIYPTYSVSCQEILEELLSVEKNIYREFAQELDKVTSESWIYVLECSSELQKDFLDILFRLISCRDFIRIQSTIENTLMTFCAHVGDSLTKENREIVQKCQQKLQEMYTETPEGEQDNIETMGRKLTEALKRCKSNAEANFVKISEDSEEEFPDDLDAFL